MDLQVIQPRTCGECSACCTTLAVGELKKDRGERCKHLAKAGGCSIYDTKPESCKAYRCMWLDGAITSEEARPDKYGVLFTYSTTAFSAGRHIVQAEEIVPGRLEQIDVKNVCFQMTSNGLVICLINSETMYRLIGAREQQWLLTKYHKNIQRIARR